MLAVNNHSLVVGMVIVLKIAPIQNVQELVLPEVGQAPAGRTMFTALPRT